MKAPDPRRSAKIRLLVVFAAGSLAAGHVGTSSVWAQADGVLLTNQGMIEGLARRLDLSDSLAVFRHVFQRLDDEVVVYPSENYYYFRFWAAGHEVAGSIALPARSRDEGVVSFGYRAQRSDRRSGEIGGWGLFSAADGVAVHRVSELVYDVVFEGRTVRFRLHDLPRVPPPAESLAQGESYLGPIFDESGLRFHLLFDEPAARFRMVLDEREEVPERFRPIAPGLVIGQRTAYAFYLDRARDRKLLVGVSGEHVLANDWYDGPFDQLPDNHIRAGRLPDYVRLIEAAYPAARGRIDRFGYYVDEPGTRVAIAPYLVYFAEEDVIARVRECEDGSRPRGHLLACLTRQEFDPPRATPSEQRSTAWLEP